MCPCPLSDVGGAVVFEVQKDEEDSEKKDEMDDDTMFTGLGEDDKSKPSVAPRWVTRVFAADCLCRIILLCENADKTHFDLAAARSAQAKNVKGTIHCAARIEYCRVHLKNCDWLMPLLLCDRKLLIHMLSFKDGTKLEVQRVLFTVVNIGDNIYVSFAV